MIVGSVSAAISAATHTNEARAGASLTQRGLKKIPAIYR